MSVPLTNIAEASAWRLHAPAWRRALHSRFGVVLLLGIIFLAIQSAVRIALMVGSGAFMAAPLRTPWILLLGLIADLYPTAIAAGAGALLLAIIPARLWGSRILRATIRLFCGVAVSLALVVAVAEWLFWAEFETRFNFLAVEYLVYRDEVAKNILESYSVGTMVAALGATAVFILWLLRRPLTAALRADSPARVRAIVAGLCVALGVLAATVDEPELGADARELELTRNGPYQFVSAFRVNEIDYEQFYVTRPAAEVMATLRRTLDPPSSDASGVLRRVTATRPERRLNVVLITVESLSGSFLGAYGSQRNLTPNLDALADQSLWFSNLYATGTRTVRGLEALTLSIPPTPGHSIVKRPGGEGLRTIGAPFVARGYDTAFIYGGYGYFDNMNAFFEGSGFRSVDRFAMQRDPVTFSNAWGVSDEDLFRRVLREADADSAAGRPFMLFTLTTSNHRPFTFPSGRINVPQGTREGAVKYTDWAIGQFLSEARRRPWFKDTIFLVIADHCATSGGRTQLPVENFRIPLFVYAPGIVEPRKVTSTVSQIDVAPTLLDLLGFSYDSSFFGRNMLQPAEERAFLATYEALGLLHRQQLTILEPKRRVTAYTVTGNREVERPVDPDELALAVVHYQGAAQVFRTGGLRLVADR